MNLTVQYYDKKLQYREEVWAFDEGDEPELRFAHEPSVFAYGFSDQKEGEKVMYGLSWPGEPELPTRVFRMAEREYPNVSEITADSLKICLPDSSIVDGGLVGYPIAYGGDKGLDAVRFRYIFTGGYIFEGGEGELVVVQQGENLRLLGDRNKYFKGELPTHRSGNYWRDGIDHIFALFDARSREMLITKEGGHFDFELLCKETNPLIGADYLMGRATVGELRTYFMSKYTQVPMFNFQLSGEIDRDHNDCAEETKDLIAKVACESNFVVLHGSIAEQDGNLIKAVDMNLLDGFMRVLWAGKDEDVVFFKFYYDLSQHQRLQLMMAANYWKSLESKAEMFFDRGLRLFVFVETGIFMDRGFIKEYMAPYTNFASGIKSSNNMFYLNMWNNALMLKDVALLEQIRDYRDQQGRPLHNEFRGRLVRGIGNFRRHEQAKDCEVRFEQIRPLLDINQDYFDKIYNMSVPGMIAKNIEEHFSPHMRDRLVAILEGREEAQELEPVVKPKKTRKKKS